MNNENIKNNVWRAGLAVAILLAVFLLIASIKQLKSISYVGRDTPVMNAITVTGKGEAVSIPDVATFSFGVTETAKAVDEAQARATTKVNAALKALKDGGVEEKDIKTLSYTINPHYEYIEGICIAGGPCRPGRQSLTGYDVNQTIQVKVRDLKKAGALFATIGSLNVQNVNGLAFSIDDIDTVREKARKEAIEDAQEKAKNLAKQLNVSLVRITSFYDQNDEFLPYAREGMGGDMMMNAKTQAIQAPSLPAGEQKITARVSITYEIR